MEFFDITKTRCSIRRYDARPIEQNILQTILEAVNRAPSAGNLQAYQVYVVSVPRDREALAKAALGQVFISAAPVALVFCAHPARCSSYGSRGQQLYALQDATIACTFAMLAATALGLASVWVGAFSDELVRQVIRAPEDQIPVAVLPIGYPAETTQPTSRRPLSDLVKWL